MGNNHLRRSLFAGTTAMALATVIGCATSRRNADIDAANQAVGLAAALQSVGSAPATLAISESMQPFFAAGLGFIILGGLVLALGGKFTGLTLMGLGVATTGTGVLFVQYPWSVLVLALAAALLATYAAVAGLRSRRELDQNRAALEATAEIIQKVPEGRAVKDGLAALGPDKESEIRAVIGPIKDKLRREGKIPG
ncbi:MAG: hypothetical protein LIP23_09240 [Planctomycetes bacterium]|nr:hypothetical protein [Planctomycetota bacterium]